MVGIGLKQNKKGNLLNDIENHLKLLCRHIQCSMRSNKISKLLYIYLPLPKHSNVTLDVCPLIATWFLGPRIISDCVGTGFLTAMKTWEKLRCCYTRQFFSCNLQLNAYGSCCETSCGWNCTCNALFSQLNSQRKIAFFALQNRLNTSLRVNVIYNLSHNAFISVLLPFAKNCLVNSTFT